MARISFVEIIEIAKTAHTEGMDVVEAVKAANADGTWTMDEVGVVVDEVLDFAKKMTAAVIELAKG